MNVKNENNRITFKNSKIETSILFDLTINSPPKYLIKKDLIIVRDLAKKIKEISQIPENYEKIKLWKDHNSLIKTRPLILCIPENAYYEIIPYKSLKTEDPFIREYEWYFRSLIYHWDELKDDYVITSRLKVPVVIKITQWGIKENWKHSNKPDGAAKFVQQIRKETDFEKLKFPKLSIDRVRTVENFEYIYEIFGDILDIELYYTIIPMFFDLSMVGVLSRLRGLEQLFFDLTDRPKWLHKIMDFLTEGTLNLIKNAESSGILGLNNKDDYINSGGLGYTYELPKRDFRSEVRLKDLWGYAESQELTSVSPSMFEEFFLPYQIKLLENFGLNYYGCCEDLTKKLKIIKKIPNLRRVSISSWTDMKAAVKELEDKYVYVWKPNPSYLAMDIFDQDLIKEKIKIGLNTIKDCIIEIIMKDTHTLRNEPLRMKKWMETVKEVVLEYSFKNA